jgi:CHAD domain-containing protein
MPNHCYAFIKHCDIEIWMTRLVQSDNWRREPVVDCRDTFYDTFDWRLYRKEVILALSGANGRHSLWCRSLTGNLLAGPEPASDPGLVRELPPGRLRLLLQPLVSVRRLLPQVSIRSRQHRLALLNSDGKTVLRLAMEADRIADDSPGSKYRLPAQLRVQPLRGYHSALQQLDSRFRNDPFLKPIVQDPLEEALDAVGRRPADYISKLELRLQPEQSSLQAVRTILLTLLGVLMANMDGIRADIDSEFLHDFRVAVRRTRSALGRLKNVLPQTDTESFRGDFAWLGSITGPSRNLDVYLLNLDDYRRLLPENRWSDLNPFRTFLELCRAQERQAMIAELDSSHFAGLLSRLRDFLEHDRQPDHALPDAELPVRKVSDRQIWKLFRRCIKEGRAITLESPAEALHELRKTCKKLRYLLEFFQSLYSPEAIATLIKALKGLQDNLGEIQDYEVQSEAISSFAQQMTERNLAPTATLLAMGMLSESLRRRQQKSRDEFHRRFEDFAQTGNLQLFRHLFGPRGRKGASDQ